MRNTLLSTLVLATILLACTSVPTPPATATVRPVPTRPVSDYTMAQLAQWWNSHGEVIIRVQGIVMTGLDETARRIKIRMLPRRGAREEMEAALSSIYAPRDAFDIRIGCTGAFQQIGYLDEIVDDSFRDGITLSVQAAPQVPYGETLSLNFFIQNKSEDTVRFFLGGRPAYDFVVLKSDGTEVWHWLCAKVRQLPLDRKTLDPGESLELSGEWDQVDNQGHPVPAGRYAVRGVLFMEHPQRLVTSVRNLEVLPAEEGP